MASTGELDFAALWLSGSGPMLVLEWGLVLAAASVWVIIVVKARQVGRWRRAHERFEAEVAATTEWGTLGHRSHDPDVIGKPVLTALLQAADCPDVLEAVAQREVERQNRRVHTWMTALSSIGVVSPLAGLFGTVYGIIHAFLRIGAAKSTSLAEVAPAIGEALITTAVGLFAAIPAVVAYNVLSDRIDDLIANLDAAAKVWAGRIAAAVSRPLV